MNLSREIESLKAEKFVPVVQIFCHENEVTRGTRANCCTAALASFQKSTLSSAGQCGDKIEAILRHIQSSFRWGIKRTEHMCDIISSADEGIDCAARSAVALLALKMFLRSVHVDRTVDIFTRYQNLQLAVVMIIIRVDPGQAKMWRKSISHLYDRAGSPVIGRWIEDNCIYHQVAGIYDENSGRLAVWEYGDWMTYSSCCEGACWNESSAKPSKFNNAIVGIRVLPYDMTKSDCALACGGLAVGSEPSCPTSLKQSARTEVFWDGEVRIPFGEWITWGRCGDPGDRKREQEKEHQGASALRVFITGCHMSGNPMPGVGMAKCLRERWGGPSGLNCDTSAKQQVACEEPGRFCPSSLHITAVDDAVVDVYSGVTDTVFDSSRSVSSYGKLRTRSKPLKEPDYLPVLEAERWTYGVGACEAETSGVDARCANHFNSVSALEDHMLWETVVDMVNAGDIKASTSFFIPCTDKDIDFFVARKEWVARMCGAEKGKDHPDAHLAGFNDPDPVAAELKARYQRACECILCPSKAAVESATKPAIEGPLMMGCFTIPEYFMVAPPKRAGADGDDDCLSSEMYSSGSPPDVAGSIATDARSYGMELSDAQVFCDRVGYPVVVKGVIGGHAMCYSWGAVATAISKYPNDAKTRSHHCFIQKVVLGAEKTILFAAVDGELTGCMQLMKLVNTCDGKVWSGELSVVPPAVVIKLRAFVAQYNWTGGGELEFIETLDESLRQPVATATAGGSQAQAQETLPNWYLIDFNPRYPAWVYACCQTTSTASGANAGFSCNLPADFITHVVQKRGSSGSVWAGFIAYESFKPVSFTRTVCEVGISNYAQTRKCAVISAKGAGTVKGVATALDDREDQQSAPKRQRRGSLVDDVQVERDATTTTSKVLAQFTEDVAAVRTAAAAVIDVKGQRLQTPQYVLATGSVRASLQRHKSLVLDALELSRRSESGKAASPMQTIVTQMCLSVKTQPHVAVLEAAREGGYVAECISMAEVRAALKAGFAPADVILTGPGKFWECEYIADPEPMRLGSIFADSVADLRTILRRVKDPNDGLKTDLVGVRLCVGSEKSRFGIAAGNPAILGAVGELIKRHLAPGVKVGVHMHFAASAPGMGFRQWFDIAYGAASIAEGFASLCGRAHIDTVDFGGGWPAYMADTEGVSECLARLLSACRVSGGLLESPFTTTVQFELGKCITERSGGLICTVLETREVTFDAPKQTARTYGDVVSEHFLSLDYDDAAEDANGTNYSGHVRVKGRALVVDACVGDISSPHVHPLFWRRALGRIASDASASGCEWTALEPGEDEIWGRSCMEFDVLMGSQGGWGNHTGGMCGTGRTAIKLPRGIKAGDQLLIACCGAYDMTMQYDFGDGIGRQGIFPHASHAVAGQIENKYN